MIGTVTTGSPVIGLVKWIRHQQSALRANLYLGRIISSYLLARWRRADMQKFGQKLMVTALPLIKNPSPADLEQMGHWSVEYELWPKRRQDVLHRLARHVADGAQVVIASSVYEPTVAAFASRVGVGAIGTPLQISAGRVRFAESLVADENKAQKVLSHLGVEKIDAAYGDTWADIPLLERATKPTAVYPDAILKATALERGWEILGDRDVDRQAARKKRSA